MKNLNQKELSNFIATLAIIISLCSMMISSFGLPKESKWNSINGEPGFKEYNEARAKIVISGESRQ